MPSPNPFTLIAGGTQEPDARIAVDPPSPARGEELNEMVPSVVHLFGVDCGLFRSAEPRELRNWRTPLFCGQQWPFSDSVIEGNSAFSPGILCAVQRALSGLAALLRDALGDDDRSDGPPTG